MIRRISILLLLGSLWAGQTQASAAAEAELSIDYSRFYSHIRKLSGEDTQALQFAFGFVHVQSGQLCHISNARIVTPKQTMPVTISAEQRFTLPSEKALQLADAVVQLSLAEPANQCDMSVQLETKAAYLKQAYSSEELSVLVEQYSAFFNEMGSFLSFMMPSVKGLTFQFADDNLTVPLKHGLMIQGGMLQLPTTWLSQQKSLTLPATPVRITAIASRD